MACQSCMVVLDDWQAVKLDKRVQTQHTNMASSLREWACTQVSDPVQLGSRKRQASTGCICVDFGQHLVCQCSP